MTEVRIVTTESFTDVLPLLQEFRNPAMTPEVWRRMLFDLPWPVEEAQRGYALYEGARPVGFLATIPSLRTIRGTTHRFLNLSSWIVLPSHRAESMKLVFPALSARDATITNLTASPEAHEIFAQFGFKTLETAQVLVPAWPRAQELSPGGVARITVRPEAIAARLESPAREVALAMRDTRAAQILLERGKHQSLVIATRSKWKGRLRLAHVQYASDWSLLWDCPGAASLAFLRAFGTAGLRVDARHVQSLGTQLPFAVVRPLEWPTLYRPASPDIVPQDVDGLYSELVGQPW